MSPSGRETGVVFLSGVRTGFGGFGGALKDLTATDLGVLAGVEALARSKVAPAEVDHVVFGNVLQTSADAPYLARHVGLRAGLPIETPAVTVNRLCGSGFEAVAQAGQQIMLGESRVVLAGGTESMSQAPHVVRGARWGLRLGTPPPLEDSLWEAVRDAHCGLSMAETAENLAQQYRVAREAVDCYAALSQARARDAWARGDYADEVGIIHDLEARQAHNLYAGMAAETGLPGLIFFMGIFISTLIALARVRRRCAVIAPQHAAMATAFLLAIVAYLTTGVFLHLAYERYLWILLALAASAAYVGQQVPVPERDPARRSVRAAGGLVGGSAG